MLEMDEEKSESSNKSVETTSDNRPGSGIRSDDSSSENENETEMFTNRKKKVRRLSDSDSETSHHNEESTECTVENNDSLNRTPENAASDSDDPRTKSDYMSSDRQKSIRVEEKNNVISKKFEKLFKPKESRMDDTDDYSNVKSKLSMLCDSDSSDCENENINPIIYENTHNELDQPKSEPIKDLKNRGPQRMSAKLAMEQMQKIKSESSRMLREKEISLPYHKPKQISLKDIMAKKNIQFVPGIKRPNLRMNEDQLKEYVSQLEKREKEILDLYESSSEDEKDNEIQTIKENIPESTENTNFEVNDCKLTESEHLENSIESEIKNDQHGSLVNHTLDLETISIAETKSVVSTHSNLQKSVDETETTISSIDNPKETNDETLTATSSTDDPKGFGHKSEIMVSSIDNITESTDETKTTSSQFEITSQNISCIKNDEIGDFKTLLLNALPNPKLIGTSGEFVDLTDFSQSSNRPEEVTGVNAFKKKFLYHANLKTPEEIEREKEKKLVPGTALMNFRRELEDQIREQKLQEWKRKKEEAQIANLENKIDNELSDCEDILDKEDLKKVENEHVINENEISSKESESEAEDEEIEEDSIISKKKKPKEKCDYIDDEAELDDDDSFEDDENDNEETDVESGVLCENVESPKKKKPSRIYNPFADSDTSDDNDDSRLLKTKTKHEIEKPSEITDNNSMPSSSVTVANPKVTDSMDIFETPEMDLNKSLSMDCSSDEYLPLGQKCISNEFLSNMKLKSLDDNTEPNSSILVDSLSLHSKQISNLNIPYSLEILSKSNRDENSLSHEESDANLILDNTKKQLFVNGNTTDSTFYTQDIVELCSGKFPTQESVSSQTNSKSLVSLSTSIDNPLLSQNTENELLELCTGKFIGINDNSEKIQLDGINNFSNSTDKDKNESMKIIDDKLRQTENASKKKENGIKSFLVSCHSVHKNELQNVTNDISPDKSVENLSKNKFSILSSSSDEEKETHNEINITKSKLLKSKRERNTVRKAQPLESSDEETDDEDSEAVDKNSNVSSKEDNDDKEKEIDYDSEENEIEVIPEKVISKSKTKQSEFFEQEAELTTDDEWKGSGDEDERGLDEFEWEEGDADQLDQRKVNKELERIHRHQMLDQDSREIKILQDILLEDGDLEGGTRERKFRWKNIDNNIESGAVVGDDNQEDDFDDTQNEEQWRKQRFERESFLRELMNKEIEQKSQEIPQIPTRLAIIKASLNQSLPCVQSENVSVNLSLKQSNTLNENKDHEEDKSSKKSIIPSPIKKPFMSIQNHFKKSFLSKGQAALNRLSLLTKNVSTTNGQNPSTNLSSLAPGKKKNFVFATVSPPCDNNLTEEMKMKKRKAASEISTPTIIKKMKISENSVSKSRKSLIDHLE